MDAGRLLDQFLGSGAGARAGDLMGRARQKAGGVDTGSLVGGLAAGGLLGALLSGKKTRKMAGGVARYGAAAALGAVAFKAYQNWQAGKAAETAPVATESEMTAPVPAEFQPDAPAADGQPFQLTLIRAMIAAAKADGHVDAEEQSRLFANVEAMGLDAEGKAFVFDALREDADLASIAGAAGSQEQAAEIYLVSRLAIDPDHPAETAYLEALAHRMNLPADLVAHLNRQADEA